MKYVLRCLILFGVLFKGLLPLQPDSSGVLYAEQVYTTYPRALSVYHLRRSVSPFGDRYDPATGETLSLKYSKLHFAPVKIRGGTISPPQLTKELPRLSRTLDPYPPPPEKPLKRSQTGVVIEFESAYGNNNTFIGRLQHGIQFKDAHYFINGHWETTDGIRKENEEETLAAQAKIDIDLPKDSNVALETSYFQSNIALPQLPDHSNHEKSTLNINATYQIDLNPDLTALTRVTFEQARFRDQDRMAFKLNSYRAQLTFKRIWSARNMISLNVAGYWEEFFQDRQHLDNRYYGTATLMNSFALHNFFSVDTGIRYDYFYSEESTDNEYIITPILTTRFHIFQNTALYATYHPRLQFPQFTDLYTRKLYTTVNPELQIEKDRHYFESGIKQRFGETMAVNIGLFYRDSQNFIIQIDANSDNILEYEQLDSVDFMGVRTSIQINYRKHFVQKITYIYAKHHIFSEQRFKSIDDDELRNQILTYQPDHQVQASLYWKTPFGLTLELNGTYVSEQYRNRSLQEGLIGKRFFLNANITQRLTENIQVFLLGRNLTDINTYDIIPLLDSEEITSSRLIVGGIRLRF